MMTPKEVAQEVLSRVPGCCDCTECEEWIANLIRKRDVELSVETLRDAADALDELQTPANEHPAQRDPALWLHEAADYLEGDS